MSQLQLFSRATGYTGTLTDRYRPDVDSELLLRAFEGQRFTAGATPQSVRREVCQLRAVLREAHAVDDSVTLRTVLTDFELLARVLREPVAVISRTTGRARLIAVQRFLQVVGPMLGRDPAVDLASLDARLPTRRSTGWHTTGALVAGAPGRRRSRGPTLDAVDLRRIVDAAGMSGGPHALRDHALVALHCFSGLRPEEIVRLRWEDLVAELTVSGHYGLTAAIVRCGLPTRLLLPGPASDAVEALAASGDGHIDDLSGPVLCARGAPGRSLSYRAARDVLRDACHRAGLPPVESIAMRAACAHWLRTQGLSDHEVAAVMGLARVRSVDRLLQRHAALDAQRTVREMLSR